MRLTFKILGNPKPKQGDRQFIMKQGGKQRIAHYQPKEVTNEHANLKAQIISQLPPDFDLIASGLSAAVTFRFYPPKQLEKKMLKTNEAFAKTTKPDLDNLEKMLWDAMEGVVFVNDSLIHSKTVRKIYSLSPGIDVHLYTTE